MKAKYTTPLPLCLRKCIKQMLNAANESTANWLNNYFFFGWGGGWRGVKGWIQLIIFSKYWCWDVLELNRSKQFNIKADDWILCVWLKAKVKTKTNNWSIKGCKVHPKLKIHPFAIQHYVVSSALVDFSNPYNHFMEFHDRKEFHPETQQSNLTQNNDVNIMFLAQKYTVASDAGAAFTLAVVIVAHARHLHECGCRLGG